MHNVIDHSKFGLQLVNYFQFKANINTGICTLQFMANENAICQMFTEKAEMNLRKRLSHYS